MKQARWWLLHVTRSAGLPGWAGAALALACGALWFGASAPLASETARLAAGSAALEQRLAQQRPTLSAELSPQQQLEAFARRFPGEKGIAPTLARLHVLAKQRGVQIEQGEFKLANEPSEALGRYTIVLPVKADYRALRRFSRDLLREMPGLALEEVNLRRSDAKAPLLEAQLRLVLFLGVK